VKFKSQVYTQVSGSVGGITYARNTGGMYARARSVPVDPASTYQIEVRGLMAALVARWPLLTPAQRTGWDLYASNVPLVNPLGDTIYISGLNMYIRSNVPRQQSPDPVARIDDAPTVFALPALSPYTAFALRLPDRVSIGFVDTDSWVNEDGGAMLVSISRPTSPTINFYKGPYRKGGAILGSSTTPPTVPQTIPTPFVLAAGQQLHLAVRATGGDGGLSTIVRKSAIEVPT